MGRSVLVSGPGMPTIKPFQKRLTSTDAVGDRIKLRTDLEPVSEVRHGDAAAWQRQAKGWPEETPHACQDPASQVVGTKASSDTRLPPCAPHRSGDRRTCARRCRDRAATCHKSAETRSA